MNLKSEVKIGIIVLVTLLVVIWGINYLKGRNILKRSNVYYAVYHDISGLDVSASVFLKGFKVGLVNDIRFKKKSLEDIVVAFTVVHKFRIPLGSEIELFSSDIMGTKALQIKPSGNIEYHQYNDTLKSSVEEDLMTQLQEEIMPLKNKAEDAIVSADSLLKSIRSILDQENKKNLSETFFYLNKVSKDLSDQLGDEGDLNQILNEFEKFSGTLSENRIKLEEIFSNVEVLTDSISHANVAQTIEQLNSTFLQTSALLSNINKGKGSLGLLASDDSLYTNLQLAVGSLNSLLQDLEANPERYVHFSLFGRKKNTNN